MWFVQWERGHIINENFSFSLSWKSLIKNGSFVHSSEILNTTWLSLENFAWCNSLKRIAENFLQTGEWDSAFVQSYNNCSGENRD